MHDLKEYSLAEFLAEQSTNHKSGLPYVHSTEAANVWEILKKGHIEVTACDTFTGENLAYFFYGRPAYRKLHIAPQDWQLPLVFVMKNTCLMSVRRVFPFDSGAFHSNRLPDYLSRFDHSGYEVSNQKDAIDLLVDIFFGGDDEYFHGDAKPRKEVARRNGLTMRHAQVQALCALYNREQLTADDRALAIEIQTDENVALKDNLYGVVLPRPFFDVKELRDYFKARRVIVKHYDVYPINAGGYIAAVYNEVKSIYKKMKVIDG